MLLDLLAFPALVPRFHASMWVPSHPVKAKSQTIHINV
jgi:hypothetical protein